MTEMTHDDRLREHVFDDDVQEFDNRLPNWWLWSFYLACIFSVGYWIHYHTLGTGALPTEEFRQQNEAAAARLAEMEVSDDTLFALSKEPTAVAAGREVWIDNCAQCHKEDASGNIGPNMTDNYWIHGGKPMDLYNTVITGVLDKGMPDYWLRQLGNLRCQQVVAYMITIKNTNLPGKEPQGEPEK